MKTKRILALIMCTLMMFASFGMLSLAEDVVVDNIEKAPTAPSTIAKEAIYNAAFDTVNTYSQTTTAYIGFESGPAASMSFTLGVPETGYYKIGAIIRNHAYKNDPLKKVVYVKTDRGDITNYAVTSFDAGATNYVDTEDAVLLIKGDRKLTFYTDEVYEGTDDYKIRIYSIKLNLVQAAPEMGEKPEASIPGEDTKREPTKNATIAKTEIYNAAFDTVETYSQAPDAYIGFNSAAPASMSFTLGVPQTGYYKIGAIIRNHAYKTENLKKVVYVKTDRGDITNYAVTSFDSGATNYVDTEKAVYLVKGDRDLTFYTTEAYDGTEDHSIRIYSIKLNYVGATDPDAVEPEPEPEPVDKFVAKADLAYEIAADAEGVTVTLADLFDAAGPEINSQDVTVTGAEVNKVAEDWTQSTITFTEAGEYTITITDGEYCNAATATVVVTKEVVVEPEPEEPLGPDNTETEPTMNSVATPVMHQAFLNTITEMTNATKQGVELYFMGTKDNTVKVKVGVPETGYYNVAALLRSNDGAAVLYNDLTLTTDRGESFTYSRATRGGSWTYAPANVYLVKGDRILTFNANMTSGAHTIMSGLRLYHMTKAFYALKNLAFEIPSDAEGVTVTADKLFATDIGVAVNSAEVEITAEGATVAVDPTDWTKSTVTFTAAGDYTVSIKDAFYGGVTTTATIPVIKLENGETEPTMNSVTTPVMHQAFLDTVTEMVNAQAIGVELYFMGTKDNTVKVKVGVPETGYYNVAALLRANDGLPILYNDMTVTTDRGESFTYPKVTRGGSWTYAPANVYLVKGDRILTFHANMISGAHAIMSGLRLYHITKAFYALKDLAFEIPGDAETLAVTADKLFATDIGVAVNSAEVEITAEGATVAVDPTDWTKSTITFAEEGEYTVNIKDVFYGGVTTAKFLVTKELVIDDVEREPTLNTVANPLQHQAMIDQATLMSNAQQIGLELYFMANKDNTVKFKVGVPETGYYNIAAILRANTGEAILYNDMTVTTDRGDSFTYNKATRGAAWTYAPTNVYLVKGDRILTFKANMTSGAHTIMTGLRLYHITKAFYALKDLAFEIPAADESITVTAGALFATDIGVAVDSSKVEITAPGATVVADAADWTKSTITFANEGTYAVSIKDDFYGGITTVEIPVTKEKSEFKTIALEGTTATVSYEKVDETVDKATLYVAEYDGNKLVGINLLPIDTTAQEIGTTQTYSIGIEGATGALKAMLFDEFMAPVLDPVE